MYSPKPETVAYRAIEYLKTLPPGTQVDGPSLAKQAGLSRRDTTQLGMFCDRAIKAKLIQRRQIPGLGVTRWWSIPGHPLIAVPGELKKPEPSNDDLAPRRRAPEIQPRPGPFLPGVKVGPGARWITPVQVF